MNRIKEIRARLDAYTHVYNAAQADDCAMAAREFEDNAAADVGHLLDDNARLTRELEVARAELAGGRKLALAFCLAGAGEDQDELDALVEFADPDGSSGVAKLKGE